MRKFFRGLATAFVLLFMLFTYISASSIILIGLGYSSALKNNEGDVLDYTATSTFRRVTLENFDSLYAAVTSDGDVSFRYDDELVYFAYSAGTGLTLCSDPEVYDVPTFESLYLDNASYPYYCRYSAGTYKGESSASGESVAFEVPYERSGTEIFDGEQRNYGDTVIILAVLEPRAALEGYGYARIEFTLLKNGMHYLFAATGAFLVAMSVVLSGGSARRRIERAISSAVSWVYIEFKLAVIALAVWLIYGQTGRIGARFFIIVLALGIPLLYIIKCNAQYAPRTFFKKSLCYDLYLYLKSIYDRVVPVMPLQIKVRRQVLTLFIFGFALPFALFFASDAFLGLAVVRILIPFYILYFGVVFALFFKGYSSLVNDISELTRFSSAITIGDRLPDIKLDEKDDLYELKTNISKIDESISAAADLKFRQSNKKLSEILSSLSELKEQSGLLKELAGDTGQNNPEILAISKRIASISDKMTDTIMLDSPVTAPVLKRIDFLALLDEVMNSKLPELSAAQLKVHAKLPPPPAFITADMSHIRAALDILLSNLAMYALSGSDVEMVLRKEGQVWRFIIVNIESPYACSDNASVALATGLSLAKEYLALNGGRLEHTSDGNKFGVSFVLPVAH